MNKEEQVVKVLNDDEIRDFILKKDYEIFKLQQRIDKAIDLLAGFDSGQFCDNITELSRKIESILRGEE